MKKVFDKATLKQIRSWCYSAFVMPDSRTVIQLLDEHRNLRRAVKRSAAQFRRYEAEHLAKGTEDGARKAETNAKWAEQLESLLP